MRTLLIINDNSPEARQAAEFALTMAQRAQANLILANNYINIHQYMEMALTGEIGEYDAAAQHHQGLLEYLKTLNESQDTFSSEIEEMDISQMDETALAEFINTNHIWMMIKGMPDCETVINQHPFNVHTVLNKVLCPLLLIPSNRKLKSIERLAYIADLRYCRIEIVRYLAELARPWGADLSIAHRSAKGLPDMEENYALTVFSEEVCKNVNYDKLFFNNIRETDLERVVDVLINGMHNDILVMVNHRFHFEEILGRYITDTLPLHITVPLLIFPY